VRPDRGARPRATAPAHKATSQQGASGAGLNHLTWGLGLLLANGGGVVWLTRRTSGYPALARAWGQGRGLTG